MTVELAQEYFGMFAKDRSLAGFNTLMDITGVATWFNQGDQKIRVKFKLKGKQGLQPEIEPADWSRVLQVAERANTIADKIKMINERNIGGGEWVEHPSGHGLGGVL